MADEVAATDALEEAADDFVNSMSDLFHKDIDRAYIDQVFDAMEHADLHVYQVLTKRSSLMRN